MNQNVHSTEYVQSECIHIIRNNKANTYIYLKEADKMLHVLKTIICTFGDLIYVI